MPGLITSDSKKFTHLLFGPDHVLTEEAINACQLTGINPKIGLKPLENKLEEKQRQASLEIISKKI